MYILPSHVTRSQTISHRAKTALYFLASLCGSKNYCFPKVRTIAEGMSTSLRTSQRALKELVEKGLIKRKFRHRHRSAIYTLTCLEHRGPARAEKRRAIHNRKSRGDSPDAPFLEQNTSLNNAINPAGVVQSTVQPRNPQVASQANDGLKATDTKNLLKPRRMHPIEARLIASDIAEVLGQKSYKFWLKIAWRCPESDIHEALSFVRSELLEGHVQNAGGLFVYRLRKFHGLQI